MSNLRTSIKDIPVANDRLNHEVARTLKVTIHQVKETMNFVGLYTAEVIREGAMETVMLPGFGKFEPKVKAIRAFQKTARDKRNGKEIIVRALKGRKNIIPKTPPPDEVI